MSVTRFAIEKNRVTLVLVAVLLGAGFQSYRSLPRAEDPGFTVRTALVQTVFPGAGPERVEQLVTDKLEKAIQEIPELDSVVSQSKTGVSIILVNIKESYKDMRPIWDNLRRKVERASSELPEDVIGPTVNDEFGDVFGTILTITSEDFTPRQLQEIADQVRDELLLLPDASKVEIFGTQEERVFVEYSNSRLADLGLSPAQLRSVLAGRNIINPGGDFRTEYEEVVIEPTGNFESVEDVGRALITLPSGETVPLGDFTEIRRGYVDPPRLKVRGSGVPGLALAVALRDGGNIIDLGARVRETIDRIRPSYPIGVDFDFVQFQADAVERKVQDFVGNLVQAIAIVIVVMLLSLGVRTGLVVASLIPSAIVITFLFLPMVGVGIDQMSLAALIIALGLLVDNAIVMSESILVQMGQGKSAKDAAVDSAAELRLPLLTSSLTTAAAFLPIFLAESAVGEYTGSLFKVVTITLLCSWALSLTLIPLLCVLFLKVKVADRKEGEGDFDSRGYRLYRGMLLAGLRRPILSVAAVLVIFFASLQLFRFVPAIFFPPNDRPSLTAELFMPLGTPLAKTEEVAIAVEAFVDRELRAADGKEGVTAWVTYIGNGGARFYLSHSPEQSSPNYALLVLNTSNREITDHVIERLRIFCETTFPGLKARVQPLQNGPSVSNPIEIRVSGRETDGVFQRVEAIKARLRSMEGPTGIADDWGAQTKKIIVDVDRDRAQRAGITHQDVALSLQTLFSGFTTTEYREGDDLIPIVLRSAQARDVDLQELGSINVFSQSSGRSVPVAQVARAQIAWQPGNIRRRDRLQTVTVQADLEPGYTVQDVVSELEPWLEEESASWPLGYGWELGGEDEASATANQSIAEQLPVAGLLIVLLLVAQFNSIRKPAIILATIPLGLIGVVIGLLVLRSYIGFMTLLGIVSLAGIVINNAIVLLDRIQIEIDAGLSPQRAIVESGQQRLRPIVLTTLTTLGGMIPLYLGGGAMFEPMAAAIMAGLIFATALTLGFVPVMYALLFRVGFKDFEY